jgi:hypothetical protein
VLTELEETEALAVNTSFPMKGEAALLSTYMRVLAAASITRGPALVSVVIFRIVCERVRLEMVNLINQPVEISSRGGDTSSRNDPRRASRE